MSLADYEIRYEEVTFQGKVVDKVRGIALNDIASLIRDHLLELNRVFDMYEKEGGEVAVMQAAAFALKMVEEVPDLVDSIIIAATDAVDEPGLRSKLKRLPIGLTIEVMRKIIEITVEDAGGAKKLLDNIAMTVRTMRPSLETPATA